jgi:hypothetical protein
LGEDAGFEAMSGCGLALRGGAMAQWVVVVALWVGVFADVIWAQAPKKAGAHSALVIGDSLGLCGFGKRLDQRLRESPHFNKVHTYMACGTVPLSWIQQDGYRNARTLCGFWSIEGEGSAVKNLQDTYGMSKGHRPAAHTIPKMEELLPRLKPEVLVVQLGTNLHGIFPDNTTVVPDRHGPTLRRYLTPFLERLAAPGGTLRKVYWVCPPKSGRMSSEVQDFVLATVKRVAGSMAVVIDSRELISYPYAGMSADKEHFFGADMTKWADAVFQRIESDLEGAGLPKALEGVGVSGGPGVALKDGVNPDFVRLKVRLASKSPVLDFNQLLPYQESAVIYRYEVLRVLEGKYAESQVLICHPAHIRLQAQPLNRYSPGGVYEMQLMDLDSSRWSAIKTSDHTGRPELSRYIQVSDEKRFPSGSVDSGSKEGER